jgi:hypothetical protein
VVEHSTANPEIKGLNPAPTRNLKKWEREINIIGNDIFVNLLDI